ncbi:hypothetical protein FHS95_000438 [Sphingomonas naasensis]|uniref:Uncharacterized protein n=1 Tax=Sphingomonas naasensis TaxID=1344951 RepID=A0A4V6RB58_9SPHN|nr:hypothetical protein [Sphingomonas naasensis]NIJ18769.1 hypothetical protein [Sphingomonas naasensis]TGX46002.1 hypothetical protein E5A74_02170 [Sphingomonas naasensis]
MLIMTFAALGLAAVQTAPRQPVQYRTHHVTAGLKAGCKVWAVHTPAGKIGSHRAIVRCPAPVEAIEADAASKSDRVG